MERYREHSMLERERPERVEVIGMDCRGCIKTSLCGAYRLPRCSHSAQFAERVQVWAVQCRSVLYKKMLRWRSISYLQVRRPSTSVGRGDMCVEIW